MRFFFFHRTTELKSFIFLNAEGPLFKNMLKGSGYSLALLTF